MKKALATLAIATVALLTVILVVAAVVSQYKQHLKDSSVLVKPATGEQYQTAEHPCPAYEHPDIRKAEDGSELGDCDGDGKIDEVHGPKDNQWTFILRPGITEVRYKVTTQVGSDILANTTIFDAVSPWADIAQQKFEQLPRSK